MNINWITSRELKKLTGVTTQTIMNWRKSNKIKFKELNKRNFLYDINSLLNKDYKTNRKTVAYCRVSNSKQSDDLKRQEESIRIYASNNGILIDEFYTDIASGMNEQRKQFNKLLSDVIEHKISRIIITFKDRLTRFGFDYFVNIFKKFDCEIIILNTTNESSFEQELSNDLISIIHHFSMKLYSNRRNKLKQIEKIINE